MLFINIWNIRQNCADVCLSLTWIFDFVQYDCHGNQGKAVILAKIKFG